jgi:hypothetical protein
MADQSRRKELRAQYDQAMPEAGVYRIVNTRTGKALLGSATNLASIRHKVQFAQSTRSAGVLDQRLSKDIRQYGLDAFALEIVERLEASPAMTPAEIAADLAALEALWREKSDPEQLY